VARFATQTLLQNFTDSISKVSSACEIVITLNDLAASLGGNHSLFLDSLLRYTAQPDRARSSDCEGVADGSESDASVVS
jgi:hypothetical protein